MNCPNCNVTTEKHNNFCTNCGYKLNDKFQISNEKSNYCFHCGTEISQIKSLQTHDETKFVGERKVMTVMFADVCGFTTLSENHDYEYVMNIINNCFKRLVSIIYKYEGHVDKYIGDCIMSLFGVPTSHEDDPKRAVQTAIEMLLELEQYNKDAKTNLGLSIGINAGEAVADFMGSELKKQFTVIGDTVNTAQRLQSKAGRNQILVGRSVYESCREYFDFQELEPLQLKGKAEKVACYAVLGKKQLHKSSAKEGNIIFVNRNTELATFNKCIAEALNNAPQILSIYAQSGYGKTALVNKFMNELVQSHKNFIWFRIDCQSYTRNYVFYLVNKILASLAHLPSFSGFPKEKIDELRQIKYSEDLIYIKEALKILYNDEGISNYDEETFKKLVFKYTLDIFRSTIDKNPLLLVIDDINWLDSQSLELINYILGQIQADAQFVLVSTTKETSTTAKTSKIKCTDIKLESLNQNDSHELTRLILGSKDISEKILNLIYEKTEGVPFFIEETIKTFQETRIIYNDNSIWRLNEKETNLLSTSIREMLQARIDNLSGNAKKTLQAASIIGKELNFELIELLSDEKTSKDDIDLLEKRDLIHKTNESSYSFKHELIRLSAYNSILKKKVVKYHEALAKIYEIDFSRKLNDSVEEIAYHYERAESWENALNYLDMSAAKHKILCDHSGAVEYLKRALNISNTHLKHYKLLQLRCALAESLEPIGRIDEILIDLKNSLGIKDDSSNNEKAVINRYLGRYLKRKGDYKKALEHFDSGISLAVNSDIKLDLLREKAVTYRSMAKREEALTVLNDGLKALEKSDSPKTKSQYLNSLANIKADLGLFNESEALYNESLELKRSLGDLIGIATILSNLGIIYIKTKNFEKAQAVFDDYQNTAKKIDDKIGLGYAGHNLGGLYFEKNDYNKSKVLFEESGIIAKEINDIVLATTNNIYLGMTKFKLGEKDKGFNLIKNATAESDKINNDEGMFWGRIFLSEIEKQNNNTASAIKYLNEAKEIAIKRNNKEQLKIVEEKLT